MDKWRPKSTKSVSPWWRLRNHVFKLLGVAALQAAWQCRHCQRECEALRNVKGDCVQLIRLSRFSPGQDSGGRASPDKPEGAGQWSRPKNMKLASQLPLPRNRSCILVFLPRPQRVEWECSALKNVKSQRVSEGRLFTFFTCPAARCQGSADHGYDTKAV